jgi:hypothetical protein
MAYLKATLYRTWITKCDSSTCPTPTWWFLRPSSDHFLHSPVPFSLWAFHVLLVHDESRGEFYTMEGETMCIAFLHVSQDPIVGVSQKYKNLDMK